MKTKTKKSTKANGSKAKSSKNTDFNYSEDVFRLAKDFVRNSALVVFWETVDKFQRKVKINIQLGARFFVGLILVLIGLVFLLVGLSRIINEILNSGEGLGYLIVGIIVVVVGIFIVEKVKTEVKVSDK